MAVYVGDDWEVRLADSEENLASATKIPFVTSWSYDKDPGIEQVPKGMGYGPGKEVHATLTEITGSLERRYDDTALKVDGGTAVSPFGVIANMDAEWWLEMKNTITGRMIKFSGVRGHYTHDHAEDDFGTETWDWAAETYEEEAS